MVKGLKSKTNTGVNRFDEYIYTKDKNMGFVLLVFIECQSCPSAVSWIMTDSFHNRYNGLTAYYFTISLIAGFIA